MKESSLTMMLAFLFFATVAAEYRTNFHMTHIELCNSSKVIKLMANVTNDAYGEYLTFDITSPVPFDQNIGLICVIESVLNNVTSLRLFTIREKYACESANKLVGEFWYELMRRGGATPGYCPIPSGWYHANHVKLNYRTIKLQTFPFGTIRFKFQLVDNRDQKVLLCVVIEVENIPN